MNILFNVFAFVGTVSFAISGAMEGIRHKMDLFGVIMLGIVTATGGGILRDIVIGSIPPSVFRDPTWAIVALIVSLLVFIVLRRFNKMGSHLVRAREMLNFVADTGGARRVYRTRH